MSGLHLRSKVFVFAEDESKLRQLDRKTKYKSKSLK